MQTLSLTGDGFLTASEDILTLQALKFTMQTLSLTGDA
eukprot:CAMPEP_0173381194 /NCGR_PEP_ID=MMETSP1356-20130122/3636_1 /TAXON_ID=77927 ORGANISM="Hemiselmis virescens, Strain PCC157" /NCGR_SAMPLE_ID=MMETSP1356 /ASSEMBLY_ACC=CAM_ASM_000847 /LENGTH=37 /DNA_ID= /DNA_START= /DNA_END= /DNA_ORIENTATION=